MHPVEHLYVRPLSWRCASIRLLFGGLSPLLSADSGHWVVLLNSHSRTYTCRYYLATVLPSIALTLSPFHFLWNGIHAVISPAAGHSGWEDHWQSDQHHYIHHATFESNCKSVYPYVCLSRAGQNAYDLQCMQVCAYNTGALALTAAARYLLFPLCGWPGLNHRWRRWYTRGRFLRHPPRHSLGQGQALRGRCVRRRSGHATRGGWADRDGFLNCVHICPCAKQQAREPQPEP